MITVKLFALLREKAGCDELRIQAGPATVSDLLKQVVREFPSLSDMITSGSILLSVNHEHAGQDSAVRDGDEVALMPPFSGGGSPAGHVRIQQEPFSLDDEIGHLKQSASSIGAIVTFLGTTRDISKGKPVAQLEFEHYPGMAEKRLAEIRDRKSVV
jgi:MoaD family protein